MGYGSKRKEIRVGEGESQMKLKYKVIKYCSFYAGGDADGDCMLFGSNDITESRKCIDINCRWKDSGEILLEEEIESEEYEDPFEKKDSYDYRGEYDCTKLEGLIASGGSKSGVEVPNRQIKGKKPLIEPEEKLPDCYFYYNGYCEFHNDDCEKHPTCNGSYGIRKKIAENGLPIINKKRG